MSLQLIQESLQNAYTYIVAPIAMMDTPVEMSKMLNGNEFGIFSAMDIKSVPKIQTSTV